MSDLDLTKKGEAHVAAALAADPETLLVRLTNRKAIADSIERLIDMLDTMSPDPDLEDGADDEPDSDGEPYLGWTMRGPEAGGINDDCELDNADDEDSDPAECSDPLEPSLCGTAIYNPTTGGMETDLEGDGDGHCMRADDEYELGWTEHIDQRLAGKVEEGTWNHPEGEPDLGWSGYGCQVNEPRDDREGDDEREQDHGDYDGPGTIMGGQGL